MRDRLAELRAEAPVGSNDPSSAPEPDVEANKKDMSNTPLGAFFEEVHGIRTAIGNIKKNVTDIESMQNNSLNALSDDQETGNENLEKLMDTTSKLATDVKNRLKEMDISNKKVAKDKEASGDVRIRLSQHAALTKKYVDVMQEYQTTQVKYKNKFKQKLQRQFLIVKPDATAAEVDQVMNGDTSNIFSDQLLAGQSEARKALENIQDRHQDILRIERGIMELHQLFIDMSVLVETQGDLINQIENHVAQSVAYTEEGVDALKKAVKLQKKARRKKCGLAFCLIILLILIITLSSTLTGKKS